MKTALLHYWLLSMRGGEKVLEVLAQLFPEAPIYTHACCREVLSNTLRSHPINESFISLLPQARRNCQRYLPLMPLALRRWDFSGFDLIVSSESGPIKGIRKPTGVRHLCYCHTPMRYLWDLYDDYYQRIGPIGRLAMRGFTPMLRRYDLRSAEQVDRFVANSAFVAERIRRIYGRASTVIYPPVEINRFISEPEHERTYWLWLGALVPYKAPDLLVEAFRGLNERLVVAGDGPLRAALERLAPPNVTFLGRVDDDALPALYAGAKGLLFPGIEDFGIVPVEAQAAGTPVLALRGGGALETVQEGETGLFFDRPEPKAIRHVLEEAKGRHWDTEVLRRNAKRFSPEFFLKAIRSELARLFGSNLDRPHEDKQLDGEA